MTDSSGGLDECRTDDKPVLQNESLRRRSVRRAAMSGPNNVTSAAANTANADDSTVTILPTPGVRVLGRSAGAINTILDTFWSVEAARAPME